MKEDKKIEMKKMYAILFDEEIIQLLSVDKKDYEEGVYELILGEAKKRGLFNSSLEKSKLVDSESQVKKDAKRKNFMFFGKQSNDLKIGGIYLIIFGIITVIFNLFYLPDIVALINIIVGFILMGLGIGSCNKNIPCIYLGTFLWFIGVVFTILQYFGSIGREHQISPVRVMFQVWVLWELIKSTPKYEQFFKKQN